MSDTIVCIYTKISPNWEVFIYFVILRSVAIEGSCPRHPELDSGSCFRVLPLIRGS